MMTCIFHVVRATYSQQPLRILVLWELCYVEVYFSQMCSFLFFFKQMSLFNKGKIQFNYYHYYLLSFTSPVIGYSSEIRLIGSHRH